MHEYEISTVTNVSSCLDRHRMLPAPEKRDGLHWQVRQILLTRQILKIQDSMNFITFTGLSVCVRVHARGVVPVYVSCCVCVCVGVRICLSVDICISFRDPVTEQD